MRSVAVSIWLQNVLPRRPAASTGEFSEDEIEAWETASRRSRRRGLLSAIGGWFAARRFSSLHNQAGR